MALSNVEIIKGLGSLTICDYDTGVPITLLQSADNMKVTPSFEESKLETSRGVIDEDLGTPSYTLEFEAYEYGAALVEKCFGGVHSTYTATAAIEDIENLGDGDAYSATTGATPVLIPADAANLKYGQYTATAKTASTLTVYMTTDITRNEGEDVTVIDSLLIADDVAVTTGVITSTGLSDYGFGMTGGSGTIGMTVGDSFTFFVRPAQAGYRHDVGGTSSEYATVSAVAYPKKKNSIYRAVILHKFQLKPIAIEVGKEYSKYTISATLQYDSTKDAVFALVK